MLCVVNTWEVEQARRIGAEVKRLRGQLMRPAQWLAGETERLGLKMTRQAITDLENGRRRYVTTAELTVLAAALNTSPVALVYPGPYDEMVDILPNREASTMDAAQWFSGIDYWHEIEPIKEGIVDPDQDAAQQWVDNIRTIKLWRDLKSYERLRARTIARARVLDSWDEETLYQYEKSIQRLRQELGLSDDA